MSSEDLFPHISRPYKLQPRKPKIRKAFISSPPNPDASRRVLKTPQQKTKPSAGRRILNFFKKSVPCTSSKANLEEIIDDYSDVIDISPNFKEGPLTAPMTQSPDTVPEGSRTHGDRSSSSSTSQPSVVNTTARCAERSSAGDPYCNTNSTLPSPRPIPTSVDPFAANGESFYQAPELNGGPSTANIYDLSIYGSPTSVNKAMRRVNFKAPEAFYHTPLNIYNASHNVVAIDTKSAKVIPPTTTVDSKQFVKAVAAPVCVIVKEITREAVAPSSKHVEPSTRFTRRLSCNFPSRPISTKTKYIFRDGRAHVTFKKRKRFVTYKHIQTLPAVKEEDEEAEDDSSASDSDSTSTSTSDFDFDGVPSPVNGDSLTPPVSVEDLECEEDEDNHPLTVDNDVPEPPRNAARRIAVYGRDQLHARSLSLPIMSTARRLSPVNFRPTGLRPLLLPIHVARREATSEGHA